MAVLFEHREERRQYAFLGRVRYRRVVSCPWPAVADLLPAKGSAMLEAYGGDTAAILIDLVAATDADDGGARTVLTYELLEAGTDPELPLPATWTIAPGSPQVHLVVARGVRHRVTLEVPSGTSDAAVMAVIPLYTPYPGSEGVWASRLDEFFIRDDSRPGRAALTLVFNPPGRWGVLRNNPGKAILEVVGGGTEYVPKMDLDGEFVEWEREATVDGELSRERWRVAEGKGTKLKSATNLRLSLMAAHAYIPTFDALLDTVNGSILPKFGNAGEETLLFRHYRLVMEVSALEGYSALELYFERNPNGWNNDTKVQHEVLKAYRVAVHDSDSEKITGKYTTIPRWVAATTTNEDGVSESATPQPRRLYDRENWGLFNSMIL